MDGIVETVSETFFNTGSTRLSVKRIDDRRMAVRFSVTSAVTILHLCRHSAFVAPANLRYINVVNNNKKKKKRRIKTSS